jgi:hypothetical protein
MIHNVTYVKVLLELFLLAKNPNCRRADIFHTPIFPASLRIARFPFEKVSKMKSNRAPSHRREANAKKWKRPVFPAYNSSLERLPRSLSREIDLPIATTSRPIVFVRICLA